MKPRAAAWSIPGRGAGTENWQNLTLVGLTNFTGRINRLVPIAGTQYPGMTKSLSARI